MLSPVRILVVGSGDLAARAFARLAKRSEMAVAQLTDAPAAAHICRVAPAELLPHAIIVESRCLATPDHRALRAMMDIAPVVVLGLDPGPDDVLEALRLGARGHVDWPREDDARLEGAIWTVLAGHPALSPLITLRILDVLFRPSAGAPDVGEAYRV